MMWCSLLSRKVWRLALSRITEDTNHLAASKGGKVPPAKGPAKTNGEKKADQMANSVEALKIDDTPRATSKNLDVLKEFESIEKKNEANFVVIGRCIIALRGITDSRPVM